MWTGSASGVRRSRVASGETSHEHGHERGECVTAAWRYAVTRVLCACVSECLSTWRTGSYLSISSFLLISIEDALVLGFWPRRVGSTQI